MKAALMTGTCAIGLVSVAMTACSRTHERNVESRPYTPTAAEQRRIDEKRAEERRAEERRAEERRAERARDADRRADERARRSSDHAIGGGPEEHATRVAPASASSSMTAARCEREVKCNRVGQHGKYASHAACVAELKEDIRHDLDGSDCVNGVRAKELNDCLQAIRDEQCGNALDLDGVIRLRACRSDNLCAK
jgi:hypothetical protein